jgi:pilus assembly protein Flp/PilA
MTTPRNALRLRKDSGQGMTEYIIIVGLIAIMAIGIVTVFGYNIRQMFGGATQALAGNQAVTLTPITGQNQMNKQGNLKNFAQNNQAN